MKKQVFLIFIIVNFFLILQVVASQSNLDTERRQRLEYGHVMRIDKIETVPSEIAPGGKGILKVTVRNSGESEIRDVRVKLIPPSQVSFLDDVSKRKFSVLQGGGSANLEFNIIASPDMSEGVYSSYLIIDYVNKIGDEKQDNDTFALVIKSEPTIFIKIDSSTIYSGEDIGEVTITFVNNDVADVKFLTVELQDTEDYEIFSANKKYIGDLDSDDFESIDFNLKMSTGKNDVDLPMKITYKDSLNKDYIEETKVLLQIRSAEDLGVKSNGWILIVVIVVAILIVVYLIYRKLQGRKYDHYGGLWSDAKRKRR